LQAICAALGDRQSSSGQEILAIVEAASALTALAGYRF
jgi:hypothetical protein